MTDYSTEYLDTLLGFLLPAANEELLPRFTRVDRQQKQDGSFVTEADLAMQERIIASLRQHWPETLILGEEMTVAEQQAIMDSGKPFWCLDPLDGTSNYSAGIPYFAVSICLVEQGEVQLGVVYDPVRDECFSATRDGVTRLNGEPLQLQPANATLAQATAIIDFKRLAKPLATRLVTEVPYASQRNFGASALDWCWLAAGRGHVYLHGKQNMWDYAAGQLILKQAGGMSCSFDREAVFKNQLVTRSVIAAVDSSLFEEWNNWLGNALESKAEQGK